MRNSLICLMTSFLWVAQAYAAEIEICGTLKQGEILILRPQNAQTLKINNKDYPLQNGMTLAAIGRDETSLSLEVLQTDGSQADYKFDIAPNKWDIQSIKGVEQRKVTPLKEDTAEIEREQKDVRQALTNIDPDRDDWKKGFIMPVDGVISGHFGNQRIFNGTPKNPHSGTDIAAPEGRPIKAAADGLVLLSGGNYFYSGNMVILDHGNGLQTIYAHLKEAFVQPGQTVKQGDIIGLVGKTGRVTGPHLHWGASVNNIRFRPHALLDFKNASCHIYQEN